MRNLEVLSRLALIPILLLAALPAAAQTAEEEAVAAYVDLSIARLEWALDTLQQLGRMPEAEEETTFFDQHGTDARSYYSFAGAHREALGRFLEANPEKAEAIDSLSQQIDDLIAAAEGV